MTGGAGFVGRWLAQHLEDEGDEVTVLGRRDLDVTDHSAMLELVAELLPDACYHLAAVTFAPDARADPVHAFDVNIMGTVAVLDAIRAEAPRCRVLIPSSAEVYGAPSAEELPLVEDRSLRPLHPYAASKAAQEALAQSYHAAYGIDAVIARTFNHIGPGQRADFVVASLVSQALSGGPIRVGNLDVARDFTDVRDVVRAYRLLVVHGAPGLPYNVCSGTSVSIRQVVEELRVIMGAEIETVTDPSRVRVSDPPEIRGDPTRLKRATGWQPEISLTDTLRSMVASAGA